MKNYFFLLIISVSSAFGQTTIFTATPATIAPGQSTTLAWSYSHFCSNGVQLIDGQNVSGESIVLTPAATHTYSFAAYNICGLPPAVGTVTVTVQGGNPPPPPPPPPPTGTAIPTDATWGFTGRNTSGTPITTIPGLPLTNPVSMVFPTPSQGYAGYIFRTGNYSFAPTGSLVYVLRLQATPGTVFNGHNEPENTCPLPAATARPMISRYTLPDGYQFGDGRWWLKGTALSLADSGDHATPGTWTLAAPLAPSGWSGVYGQQGETDSDYLYTLANAKTVAITLGEGCFYGHGLQTVSGSATLDILSVTYVP